VKIARVGLALIVVALLGLLPATAAAAGRVTPSAPRRVHVTTGSHRLSLSWRVPGHTGVARITGYRVTVAPGCIPRSGGGCHNARTKTVGRSRRHIVVRGLQDGQCYGYAVQARNTFGWGRAATEGPRVVNQNGISICQPVGNG
jgi:hypothetical protein